VFLVKVKDHVMKPAGILPDTIKARKTNPAYRETLRIPLAERGKKRAQNRLVRLI